MNLSEMSAEQFASELLDGRGIDQDEKDELRAELLRRLQPDWISVEDGLPKHWGSIRAPKPYVLVADARGRRSIAYLYSDHKQAWTMAEPIGPVTHWRQLPEPPIGT